MADFAVHKEPQLLNPGAAELVDSKSVNIEALTKYQMLLTNVRFAWQKTKKYQTYFGAFYVNDEIVDRVEALNHHIHAYLQDMDTLKNKIMVLLAELGKDLRGVASNKEDIKEFIEAGKEKTLEVFDGVLKHRVPHVHHGMRFIDGDLLKAENAHETIKMFSEGPMSEMLNPDYKDEWFEELKKEKEESFESAKKRWINMAAGNDEQSSGYLNHLLEIIKPSLYQFLKIKPSVEIFETLHGKND
ncbi:hypothetical protein KBB41_03025 [Candidatus Curtissbacteria bacterium]|nr:hypothetical protein [Candidatus Curtissbacteria bacterium]